MCGIVGIINLNGQPIDEVEDKRCVQTMLNRIAHRGPNGRRYYSWSNVAVGFCRLAIVDQKEGDQPLFNGRGSIACFCNGEIYNHDELRSRKLKDHNIRSGSDCAVIPYLYEDNPRELLEALEGIFALILIDQQRKKVILARDRFGVKPLHYAQVGTSLIFGSELKSLLAHPRLSGTFNWPAALSFRHKMRFGHEAHRSPLFFEEIESVLPGQYLEFDLSKGSLNRGIYWSLESNHGKGRADCYANMDACSREYQRLLSSAVASETSIDTECAIFLSGGLDSVSVGKFANVSLQAFSVFSESTRHNQDSGYALLAARELGCAFNAAFFDWQNQKVSSALWKRLLWHVELPIVGAEQYYKFLLHGFVRQICPNIKVVLSGAGSDEFNGGYTKAAFNNLSDPTWENFRRFMFEAERTSLFELAGVLDPALYMEVGGKHLIARPCLPDQQTTPAGSPMKYYWKLCYSMLSTYQLWHEDRTSAAHGLETRVPFLNHKLVELCLDMPEALHKKAFWDKGILRLALKESLSAEICSRSKVQFFYGNGVQYTRAILDKILKSDCCALIEEAFDASGDLRRIVNVDAFRKFVKSISVNTGYRGIELAIDLVNMELLRSLRHSCHVTADHSELPSRIADHELDYWSHRAA